MPKSAGSEDFDFMQESEKTKVAGQKSSSSETATSGNPKEKTRKKKEIHTPNGLTLKQIRIAQERAAHPRGLDIAAFMQEFKILAMDTDAVLAFQLPE